MFSVSSPKKGLKNLLHFSPTLLLGGRRLVSAIQVGPAPLRRRPGVGCCTAWSELGRIECLEGVFPELKLTPSYYSSHLVLCRAGIGHMAASGSPEALKFPPPIRSYDVHIYFFQTDAKRVEEARQLREEIQSKFPELKVYKFWDAPIGPHPIGMFEVDLKSPEEFARFVPWLHVNRRGLSVLVHPNTGHPLDDHTKNAMWLGEKVILNTADLKLDDDRYGYWT